MVSNLMIGDLKKMRIKGDYRLIKMRAVCKKMENSSTISPLRQNKL